MLRDKIKKLYKDATRAKRRREALAKRGIYEVCVEKAIQIGPFKKVYWKDGEYVHQPWTKES